MANEQLTLEEAKKKQEEEEAKKKKKAEEEEAKKKKLQLKFTFWRIINWGLVSYLVIRALFVITWALPSEAEQITKAIRYIGSIAIISCSLVNVFVWANQTDMDKKRMSLGINLTLVAAAIIVGGRLLRYILVSLNILTVPAEFMSVVIWITLLAGILCFSITKEKQATDKKLGKVRTPPKKERFEGKFGQDKDGNTTIDLSRWTG